MIRAKAKATAPGKWVFNLGGWSPDQFTDDKKPFTREELDKVSPDNPVFLQFTRSAQYLNSKAIDVARARAAQGAVDQRDAKGRATGITGVAGRNMLFDAGRVPRRAERRQGQPADGRHRREPEGHAQGSREGGSHGVSRAVLVGGPVSAVPERGNGEHAVLLPAHGARAGDVAPAHRRR